MDNIISLMLSNFDLSFILTINIAVYIIINIILEFKALNTWEKRIVFVLTATILSIIYKSCTDIQTNIIINSYIAAPVFWDWLAKPIASKLGIDYNKNNKTNGHTKKR